MREPDRLAAALETRTDVVYFEPLANSSCEIVDAVAVIEAGRAAGAWVVVDATWLSPCLFRPLEHGADIVLHSATKYLCGHGDALAGVVTTRDEEFAAELVRMRNVLGGILSSTNAYYLLRGMKTLPIRMARHCENAQKVAEFLSAHPRVQAVRYPGLPGTHGHEIARRQWSGYGGMLSFDVDSEATFERFLDRVELCRPWVNLGDAASLVTGVREPHGSGCRSDSKTWKTSCATSTRRWHDASHARFASLPMGRTPGTPSCRPAPTDRARAPTRSAAVFRSERAFRPASRGLNPARLRGRWTCCFLISTTPVVLDWVDDVVREAGRCAESGAEEGTFVVATTQSDARTRSGNPWFSPAGNAHCAIVLRPDFPNAQAGQIVYVAAVSAGAALAGLVSPMTGLRYRWANRILLNELDAGRIVLAAPGIDPDPMPWLVVGLMIQRGASSRESRARSVQQRARERLPRYWCRSGDRGLRPILPGVDQPMGRGRLRADCPRVVLASSRLRERNRVRKSERCLARSPSTGTGSERCAAPPRRGRQDPGPFRPGLLRHRVEGGTPPALGPHVSPTSKCGHRSEWR